MSDHVILYDFPNHAGPVTFTPDGKYWVIGNGDGTSFFWDVQTNGIARTFPAWGSAVRFTKDGDLLLTLNGSLLNFWRVADGLLVASYETAQDGGALSLDISADRKFYAYGTHNGTVVVAYMPLCVESIARTGEETVLKWHGGSGLYQLQSSADLGSNSWQNVGSATTNRFATNINSSTLFFRVQSLPNP